MDNLRHFHELLTNFTDQITSAKIMFYQQKIDNAKDSRQLFSTFKSLLHPPPLPPTTSLVADDFASFFLNKVANISAQFTPKAPVDIKNPPGEAQMKFFAPISEEELNTIIKKCRPTTCALDPIPSLLFQSVTTTILPEDTHIINSSLKTGTVPLPYRIRVTQTSQSICPVIRFNFIRPVCSI